MGFCGDCFLDYQFNHQALARLETLFDKKSIFKVKVSLTDSQNVSVSEALMGGSPPHQSGGVGSMNFLVETCLGPR